MRSVDVNLDQSVSFGETQRRERREMNAPVLSGFMKWMPFVMKMVISVMIVLLNEVKVVESLESATSGGHVDFRPITNHEIKDHITKWRTNYGEILAHYGHISVWDTSQVTSMSRLFQVYDSFNEDLSLWDVSSVTDFGNMFWGASSFNGDLHRWNTSSAIKMNSMFSDATAFNGDISSWDVSRVIDMHNMFDDNKNFNKDLSKWNVSSVTNFRTMFNGATSFSQKLCWSDIHLEAHFMDMFLDTDSCFEGNPKQCDITDETLEAAGCERTDANIEYVKQHRFFLFFLILTLLIVIMIVCCGKKRKKRKKKMRRKKKKKTNEANGTSVRFSDGEIA